VRCGAPRLRPRALPRWTRTRQSLNFAIESGHPANSKEVSALGQSRRFRDVRGMSGLPPTVDISGHGRHFAFGPISDLPLRRSRAAVRENPAVIAHNSIIDDEQNARNLLRHRRSAVTVPPSTCRDIGESAMIVAPLSPLPSASPKALRRGRCRGAAILVIQLPARLPTRQQSPSPDAGRRGAYPTRRPA
jgi:hypothetical protein